MEALFEHEPPLLDRSLLSDVHSAPEQRFWLLHEIEGLLEEAALKGPLLIVLDDLHWADSGTAAALRLLPQRLAGLSIAWVLATRPAQGSAHIRAALSELADNGADVLRLDPLDAAAVAQVMADVRRLSRTEICCSALRQPTGTRSSWSTSSAALRRKVSSLSSRVAPG
jgi:hypothetical protein